MSIARTVLTADRASTAFITLNALNPEKSFGSLSGAIANIISELRLDEWDRTSRIALFTPRGHVGLTAFLAVSSCAVCCPLDPRLKAEELATALKDLGVVAVVDGTGDQSIAGIAAALSLPLLTLGEPDYSDVRGAVERIRIAEPADVALLLQTSGTTSKPKQVALTHANVLAAAQAISRSYGLGPSDRCINPMPHHHVHGLISAGISSLLAGASQFCAPSFAAAAFDDALGSLGATWFTGSPAFHLGLLDFYKSQGKRPRSDRLRFIRSSSAPFPASTIAEYEMLFGVPLLENYGMTESASTVCSNLPPPGVRKSGSVGTPIGSEIRIVGATGADMPVGNEGEVLLRGPSIITEYASGEFGPDHFMDGWLRTGDVGKIDEDGCLFILGRTKELIKRGGHSVYPLEIDSALLSHSDVVEAICFSLPHPTLGEELVATFVARTESDLNGEALKTFIARSLSTYKVPTEIVRVAEIPKSATGKTARRSMRKAFEKHFDMQGAAPDSELEAKLLDVWRRCIDNAKVGTTDNLFLHGGDPLRAQKAISEIRSLTGIALPVRDVLLNPTVRQQTRLLEQNAKTTN